VPQSPKWHPEGDVWTHTMMALDRMVEILSAESEESIGGKEQRLTLLMAVLCHDLGKATHTTVDEEGNIRAIGHEQAGIGPSRSLLSRLTNAHALVESVVPLVAQHLKPSQLYAGQAKAAAIRRLALEVNIEQLVLVAKADYLGRATTAAQSGLYEAGVWLVEQAAVLQVQHTPPQSLLRGRDLIELGLTPSVQFKKILDTVYAAQISGEVLCREDALRYASEIIHQEKQ